MRRLDNPEFQRLKSFCTHVGQDPLLVQGAGGNASWKSKNVVRVKASGTWLAAASSQNIFLPIRRPSGLLDTIANNRSISLICSIRHMAGHPSKQSCTAFFNSVSCSMFMRLIHWLCLLERMPSQLLPKGLSESCHMFLSRMPSLGMNLAVRLSRACCSGFIVQCAASG